MATKNITAKTLRKNTRSLSRRSYQTGTVLVGGSMEWRWEVRQQSQRISLLVERQCLYPNIETYNKTCLIGWVDSKPLKVSKSNLCSGRYYNTESSLRSPKWILQSETETKSYQTIIIPAMTIHANNWKKEMAVIRSCYKSSPRKAKKRRQASSYKMKRSPI